MRGKRRMSLFLCAALAAGSIAGCAGKNEMVVEEKKDPVVLNFFLPMSIRKTEGASATLRLIDEFNASHDDIQIQVEGISVKDGYDDILEKRLASGKGDDIFTVNADKVKRFVSKGYLYDLSGLPAYDRLFTSAKKQASVGDVVYTIPLTMSVYGMYVNTKLLEQYGLSAPQDYDSWIHCCEVLKENGVTPVAINRWCGMTVPVMAKGLYRIYQSEDYENIVKGLNDGSIKIGDYMLEGFQLFEMFLQKGYYGENLTKEYVDGIPACTTDMEDFKNQKVGFAFFGCGVEKYFGDEMDMSAYEAQGVPALPDGTICIPSIADRYCVNAQSEHLEEALEVLSYITEDGSSDILKDGGGALPTREGQKGEPIGAEQMKALKELSAQEGQIPIEDMNLHVTYWDTIRVLCLEMVDGMSAEEAAEEYNQIQMELIKEYEAEK